MQATERIPVWHPLDALSALREDGVAILRRALDPAALQRVARALDALWVRGDARLKVSVPPRAAPEPLQPAHRDMPDMHVLDPHWRLCEVRQALFAPSIRNLLAAFHAAQPRLFRSRLFVRSPGTSLHRDDATCGLAPGVAFCTVWIALERIGPDQGGPVYVPSSHWLPPARLGALRAQCVPCERPLRSDDIDAPTHPARLHGLLPEFFHAEAGDAIVWDARLLHGSAPLRDREATRRSVVGHFCSSETLPPFASGLRAECGGDYCSACYGAD